MEKQKQKQNTELQKYKEVLEKNLFSKDYETTSESGHVYPTNRVKVSLVSYSWEVEVKWEVRPYSGQKIVITNSKLQLQDDQYVIKQKQVWNYIKNDETQVKISVEEFDEIIQHFKNLDTKSETSVDLKSKKTTKIDDEIKIEDIPF